jgi:2-keto-4-pentenoate hydratase
LIAPKVEPEIAFVIASDRPGVRAEGVLAATDHVLPAALASRGR